MLPPGTNTSEPAPSRTDACALGFPLRLRLKDGLPVLPTHADTQIAAASHRISEAMMRSKYMAAALCACIAALALAPADVAGDFTGDVSLHVRVGSDVACC